ncbi:hypothetical protein RJ641_035827, partial [Dillenia turbinata]
MPYSYGVGLRMLTGGAIRDAAILGIVFQSLALCKQWKAFLITVTVIIVDILKHSYGINWAKCVVPAAIPGSLVHLLFRDLFGLDLFMMLCSWKFL